MCVSFCAFKLVPKTEYGFIKFNSIQANVDTFQNATYGQHFSVVLSAENKKQLMIFGLINKSRIR